MNPKDIKNVEISPDVLFQEVSGEMVLLDLDSEQYFGLNETGTRVWALLREGSTVEQILSKLSDEYEVSQETLTQEVRELFVSLSEAGLIRY